MPRSSRSRPPSVVRMVSFFPSTRCSGFSLIAYCSHASTISSDRGVMKKQSFPQISAMFATNSMRNPGTYFTNTMSTSIWRPPSLSSLTTGKLNTASSLRTMASFIHQQQQLKQTLRTTTLLLITELRGGVAFLQRPYRCISRRLSSLPGSFSRGHVWTGKSYTTTSKNVLIFDSRLAMRRRTVCDSSSRLNPVFLTIGMTRISGTSSNKILHIEQRW
mmetsp:Transcript_8954/g.19315  ORF Transcript_8954/g.19315 Transcript_8954/m.19315 type:complete len:218 (+) Transcript_8954:148-801(+)